jgi:hypothetical protein
VEHMARRDGSVLSSVYGAWPMRVSAMLTR